MSKFPATRGTRGKRQSYVERIPLFEERLRDGLHRRGLTFKQVGAELNMHESAVGHWLSGAARPNLNALLRLAALLEVSPNYLLGWQGKKGQPSPDVDHILSPAEVAKWGRENPEFLRPTGKRAAAT